MKTAAAAVVTIKEPGRMTAAGARAVGLWLRRQAGWFMKHSGVYGKRFTARYYYREGR